MGQRNRYRLPVELKCGHCRVYFTDNDTDSKETQQEAHVSEAHRDIWIADRMRAIEQEARWALEAETERDWATDPLAIEYRALLKEWWTIPVSNAALALSPSKERTLTGKGALVLTREFAWSAKRKALQVRAAGQLALTDRGTDYRFVA